MSMAQLDRKMYQCTNKTLDAYLLYVHMYIIGTFTLGVQSWLTNLAGPSKR